MHDFITIGSATRDILHQTDAGVVVPNFAKNDDCDSLVFRLGSKYEVAKTYFNYGGGANNVAVSLSGLGFKTGTIMAVGDDSFGKDLAKYLKTKKVSTKFIQTIKNEATGLSTIINSTKDRRYVLFACRGANTKLSFSYNKYKKLKTKWLYINSLNFTGWQKIIDEIVKYKKENIKTKIHWNPGSFQIKAGKSKIAKLLKLTEVIQLNREEAFCLINDDKKNKVDCKNIRILIKMIYDLGPKTVIITDGIKGVYCYNGTRVYFQKASEDKPVDTTGAGDSFGSGFIAGYNIFDGDIDKALKVGVMNSGSVVSVRGAQNGLLNRNELLKRIKE